MICYVVIDTNVLVSALLTSHEDAATVQVVNKIFTGEVIPVFSAEILNEYQAVLRRKKFGFSQELIDNLLVAVETLGIIVVPKSTGAMLTDVKDLPFFEVVVGLNEDNRYLVTGNLKHFPKRPYIVTANQLLVIMENEK